MYFLVLDLGKGVGVGGVGGGVGWGDVFYFLYSVFL